ncbi:DUF1307 domain-containing protein [Gracilibacillus oryzae]|uniref:DUF1307 domain-containing protein n=1 Tax=Gracilibacillus oryzae TaxID=1672701 RepID=A0A7C8KT49_9BACI|nr:YehR family protein [Gracilibacillus oryzae]KAB8139237.1 DUF1307 domain-containing protein [Gracilibacillus oryzae]
MKKWMIFCMALLISITLVACNSSETGNTEEDAANENETNETAENETNENDTAENTDNETAETPENTDENAEQEETTNEEESENSSATDESAASELNIDPTGENTVTLKMEQNGATSTLTYYAQGDKVIEQTAESVLTYASIGLTGPEEAEAQFAEAVAGYQNVEGVTHSIDYQEDKLIESTKVNYDTADPEQIAQLTGSMVEGDTSRGISLQRSVQMLQEQGYEIVAE